MKAIGSGCVLTDVARTSRHAWAAVSDLRTIDREALPGTHTALVLKEALRATEEFAMALEEAETESIEV